MFQKEKWARSTTEISRGMRFLVTWGSQRTFQGKGSLMARPGRVCKTWACRINR